MNKEAFRAITDFYFQKTQAETALFLLATGNRSLERGMGDQDELAYMLARFLVSNPKLSYAIIEVLDKDLDSILADVKEGS